MGTTKEPEIDLYVVNRSLTESEEKEFSLFIQKKKLLKKGTLVRKINKAKVPIIKIDPKLDRFAKMNLFQDKVDEANKILARVGLPGEKPKRKLSVVNEPRVRCKIKQKAKRKS